MMVPLETILQKAEVTAVRADFEHLGPKPVSIVNQALRAADKEITRLTQELEASRQQEAEARDKALEEVEVKFSAMAQADLDRAERMKDRDPEMANICRDFAGGYNRAAAEVRALKSTHESKDTQGGDA